MARDNKKSVYLAKLEPILAEVTRSYSSGKIHSRYLINMARDQKTVALLQNSKKADHYLQDAFKREEQKMRLEMMKNKEEGKKKRKDKLREAKDLKARMNR